MLNTDNIMRATLGNPDELLDPIGLGERRWRTFAEIFIAVSPKMTG